MIVFYLPKSYDSGLYSYLLKQLAQGVIYNPYSKNLEIIFKYTGEK